MSVVSVRNLRVSYGAVKAVRGISFDIPKGEIFGFIGPNGAGKSTTIKVLATLMREYGGQAFVTGLEVRRHPQEVRNRIGYMPDFFGVYDNLTAWEYLHFFAAAYRIPSGKRKTVVSDVLELTDLTGKVDSQVDTLSRRSWRWPACCCMIQTCFSWTNRPAVSIPARVSNSASCSKS